MNSKKCIALYSGGLDSRLSIKIMQEKGFEVEAIYFKLPFGCGCSDLLGKSGFTQKNNIKLKIFDCTKGKLLREYLNILKKPKYGTGTGANPCKDCKIFMFKKAKEYADKKGISIIITGEVTNQRPMSQTKGALELIDKKLGFKLKRPLIEKGITGRRRDKQIRLAKKFKINYPDPAGGCLLCEKVLKKRFNFLLKNNLITEETLPLTQIARHFFIKKTWFVVSRDEKEGEIIEKFSKQNIIKGISGRPSIYLSKEGEKEVGLKLQEVYRTGAQRREREKMEKWKL